MAKVEHAGGGSSSSLSLDRTMRLCRDAMPVSGWITQIGVRLKASSSGATATGTLVFYDDTSFAFESAEQSWDDIFATRVASPSSAIRVSSGANVNWGYRTTSATTEDSFLDNITGHNVRDYVVSGTSTPGAPATLPLEDATLSNVGLFGYYEYTANATPSAGTWRTPSADGTSVSPSPTLEGYMPHPAEDSALDHSTDYQVQVYVLATGAITVDQVYATSSTERTNGYWTRQFTLSAGVEYGAKFRHMDSFGVWSAWSAERTFLTEGGPNIPVPESPTTKINVISGYSYSAGYSHPDALAANAAQVELYNSTGSSLLYDSGTVVVSVPSGSTVSVAEWHADLVWATGYQWRMRIRDTDGVWSQYSAKTSFSTNSPPSAPTNLSPSDEAYTPTRTLTASVTDPDNDAITSGEAELVVADTNVVVLSAPWAAKSVYALGDERRPTTANTHRYAAQNAGMSGPTEPTFPTTTGATVRDNSGIVVVPDSTAVSLGAAYLKPGGTSADAEWYEVTTAGTTAGAGAHPAYPITDGETVTDGTAVLTTRKTISWIEAGSDAIHSMSVSGTAPSQTASVTIPAAAVTLGTRYKWRARASDGHPNSPGAWSAYAFYRYQNVPGVSVVVPDPVTTVSPSFTATYTHPDSLDRTHSKTVLQKLSNGVYSTIYDSGWTANSGIAGSTWQVTFPANTVRNHETYRLKVYARDTGLGEGESPYYVFTTDYEGPPALVVNVASADASKAEIVLAWEPSTLTPAEFAGIQVQKAAPGEDTEIVHVDFDPAATGYVYCYPRSAVQYTISVRQVKNVGVEQVESDWAVSNVTVDYSPYSFLKDTDDPENVYAAFDTTIENLAAIEEDAPMSVVLPWGQSAYSHDFSTARLRSGEVVAEFHPDALNIDDAQTRYSRVRDVVDRRRAICLLTQLPDPEKVFIAAAGSAQRSMLNVVAKAIRFPWQETLYSESWYERNGVSE